MTDSPRRIGHLEGPENRSLGKPCVLSEENLVVGDESAMDDWHQCKQAALVDGEIVRISLNRMPAPTIAVTNEQGFSMTGKPETPLSQMTLFERAKFLTSKRVNYFSLHFCYFIVVCLIGAALLFMIDDISFIDSTFIAVSAMCVTGLSTVDFSKVSVKSQIVVLFLILVGSQVFMTIVPLLVRRHHYKIFVRYHRLGHRNLRMLIEYQVLLG